MGILDAPGAPKGTNQQLVKWSNVGTRAIVTGQPGTQTLNASGESYNEMIALEAPFDAVRLIYMNPLAAAKTIGPVKVAAIASAANPHAFAATAVPVTFGGSTTGTIAAGTGPLPSLLASDWTEITSVARNDGGTVPLLATFTFLPNSNTQYAMPGARTGWTSGGASLDYSAQGDPNARRWWACYKQNGDFVTDPTTWPNTYTVNDYAPVAMVQFRTRGRIVTVLGLGDSIMQGAYASWGQGDTNNTATANYYSLAHIQNAGVFASTPALPVTVVNAGSSGQTTDQYYARLAGLMSIIKPDVLVYPPFSPNNNPLTTRDAMIRQASTVLRVCAEAGTVPLFTTSIPSGFVTADDAGRLAVNAVTRSLPGVVVADHAAIIGDGATPERIAEPYHAYVNGVGTQPDPTHPNGYGHYKMGLSTAAALKKLLAGGVASAAPRPVGTTAGTVAAGDDARLDAAVLSARLDLTAAQEPYSRILASNVTLGMASGTMRLVYHTANRTETVNSVRLLSGATAAGASPTLARAGLYSVAANGDLTLLATTTNDTTLFAAGDTRYVKALNVGVPLVKGSRYAIGVLFVTAAAAPTIRSTVSTLNALDLAEDPRICGTVTGQTDIPASVANASVNATAAAIYAALIP